MEGRGHHVTAGDMRIMGGRSDEQSEFLFCRILFIALENPRNEAVSRVFRNPHQWLFRRTD